VKIGDYVRVIVLPRATLLSVGDVGEIVAVDGAYAQINIVYGQLADVQMRYKIYVSPGEIVTLTPEEKMKVMLEK